MASINDAAPSGSSSTPTLPVTFSTRTSYTFPPQKFMIPATWKRFQLSQLINKALSLPSPVPFDFFVCGEMLRGSLLEWCTNAGVGLEETVELEYAESVMPPQRLASIPQESWIAAVSCQIPGLFVTGSYDASLSIYSSTSSFGSGDPPLLRTNPHSGPLSSICTIPEVDSSSASSGTAIIATASHDLTAVIHSMKLPTDSGSSIVCEASCCLSLHTAPIASIVAGAVGSSGTKLLTAGWDGAIGFWDGALAAPGAGGETNGHRDDDAVDEQADRKKRRKVTKDDTSKSLLPERSPLVVMTSHVGRVSKAIFGDGSTAYSCGFDSTVRSWDVETGLCTGTLNASEKPFLDLALTADRNMLIASSTDRTATLYDSRALSTSSQALSTTAKGVALLPHPSVPSCLASSPDNGVHVLSGGYDGVVRLWDVRSPKAAISAFRPGSGSDEKTAPAGKVLCLDWAVNSTGEGVVAVGAEHLLDVWRIGRSGVGGPSS